MHAHQKQHKNKTLTTLLALTLGMIGAHRFYLYGKYDAYAWIHASSLPITIALTLAFTEQVFIKTSPLLLSALAGFMAALINGLTSDEHWDRTHNTRSNTTSDSGWLLALLLVFAMIVASTALIATIARTLDLMFTGGAYG